MTLRSAERSRPSYIDTIEHEHPDDQGKSQQPISERQTIDKSVRLSRKQSSSNAFNDVSAGQNSLMKSRPALRTLDKSEAQYGKGLLSGDLIKARNKSDYSQSRSFGQHAEDDQDIHDQQTNDADGCAIPHLHDNDSNSENKDSMNDAIAEGGYMSIKQNEFNSQHRTDGQEYIFGPAEKIRLELGSKLQTEQSAPDAVGYEDRLFSDVNISSPQESSGLHPEKLTEEQKRSSVKDLRDKYQEMMKLNLERKALQY